MNKSSKKVHFAQYRTFNWYSCWRKQHKPSKNSNSESTWLRIQCWSYSVQVLLQRYCYYKHFHWCFYVVFFLLLVQNKIVLLTTIQTLTMFGNFKKRTQCSTYKAKLSLWAFWGQIRLMTIQLGNDMCTARHLDSHDKLTTGTEK